ncbi:outer membrane protein assembly factor BamB [Micromonospora sp. M71_S20]|uniref:outer membrane protein assembly factor BamB family protein n=1 Tax=Micromonospora sp. M71_S20 TaxID=592872 RepID=UPI000EB09BAC|nr:PQQ-binding-like beta-propeller repeat protein [Micromonospora sp. M71_S20]RLK22792.1 outer membrane protein assembly factor BamB [Micromonospora sp. M71_S20]
MTVIDLGEVRDEPGSEEARRPRPPRAVGRPLRVALALALVVATVAGATPAPQRIAVVVPAGPGSEVFLHGDRLYVVDRAEGETAGTAEVLAYALPERSLAAGRPSAPLWRALVRTSGRISESRAWPGVVLFTIADVQGTQSLVLDAATGRERWRQPGYPRWDRAGTLLMQSGGEDGGTVRLVDPASGRAIWSARTRPMPAMYDVRDGRIDRIVMGPARGQVEVRDARSGELLHAADLRLGELPGPQQTMVAHGLLLVHRPAAGVLTAYELDGLRRRWEISLPMVAHVEECGPMICANRQSSGFSALDPATGAVRWTGDRWAAVLRERAGRLLAIETAPLGERYSVLDAATGRVTADLGVWTLLPWYDDDRLLAVRVAKGGGLVVAELDVAAGLARVLDVLREAILDCRSSADALARRRLPGDLGVWRYPG